MPALPVPPSSFSRGPAGPQEELRKTGLLFSSGREGGRPTQPSLVSAPDKQRLHRPWQPCSSRRECGLAAASITPALIGPLCGPQVPILLPQWPCSSFPEPSSPSRVLWASVESWCAWPQGEVGPRPTLVLLSPSPGATPPPGTAPPWRGGWDGTSPRLGRHSSCSRRTCQGISQ